MSTELFDVNAYRSFAHKQSHAIETERVPLGRALEITLNALKAGMVNVRVRRTEGERYGLLSFYPEHRQTLEGYDRDEVLELMGKRFDPLGLTLLT